MSYTNVVFKQHIARNVNRDEIEHQRIDDRSNKFINIVGFQSRFQTAGTLIYNPPKQSSLNLTCRQQLN